MKRTRKVFSMLLAMVMIISVIQMQVFADTISDHDRISIAAGEYTEITWRSAAVGTSDYAIGDIAAVDSSYYPSSMVLYVTDGTVSGTGITTTVLDENDAATAYNLQLPSTAGSFTVTLDGGGVYTIYYSAPSGTVPDTSATLYAYCPAPGQFTNEGVTTGGWGDAYTSTGVLKENSTTGMSLGSFGGYAVYKFDSDVNNASSTFAGTDFIIYGNAFWGNSEPGHIQVAQDVNGNPGDANGDGVVWYDIAGSRYYNDGTNVSHWASYTNPTPSDDSIAVAANNLGTKANVPYVDSESSSTQYVYANNYHNHSYFPLYCNYFTARNGASYPISRYNTLGRFVRYNHDTTNGSTLTLRGVKMDSFSGTSATANYAFGYADVHPNKTLGGTIAYNPYVPCSSSAAFNTNAANTSGGDPIDISWAVYPAEKENGTATNKAGEPVNLSKIRYVRVYTSVEYNHPAFGETSTEVDGIATVSNTSSGVTAAPTIKIGNVNLSTYVLEGVVTKTTVGNVVVYNATNLHFCSGSVTASTPSAKNIYVNSTYGATSASTSIIGGKMIRVIVQESNKAPYIAVIVF